jgi:hypothetical protein
MFYGSVISHNYLNEERELPKATVAFRKEWFQLGLHETVAICAQVCLQRNRIVPNCSSDGRLKEEKQDLIQWKTSAMENGSNSGLASAHTTKF